MPRRPLFKSSIFPYHITSRSNNKEWFYLPTSQTWDIFCENLVESCEKYNVLSHAFVLMANHFHLILTTPLANIDEFTRHFLTNTSKSIQYRAKRINHIFGSRYKWSILDNCYSAAYVYKYVLRNPVRANIVSRVEDYHHSSILNHAELPIVSGTDSIWRLIPKNETTRLDWLNQPTPKELEKLITQGLRRQTFELSKDNTKQKDVRYLKSNYLIEQHL